MRITLVISQLGSGGAERVMSTMANYWAENGRDVTIVTLSTEAVDWCGLQLHPSVKRVGLDLLSASKNISAAVRNNLKRIKRLRQELQRLRPDVAIAFGDATNVLTLMASPGLGMSVIVSERIDPRHHPIGSVWTKLRSLLYPYADALVIQTDAVRDWAKMLVKENAIHIIPNPIQPVVNGSKYPARCPGSGRTLVAVGRLDRQKGFDLLLRAYAICAKKHDAWSLVIVGEGEERGVLEALAEELGLKDRVSLPGRVKEPAQILRGADLFVLASRYEGFPNALLEAMACGLAVISTDCASGPRAIIRDGLDGVLVPPNDVDALALAMDRLMANQAERQRLGARAVEVVERFSIQAIMKTWDDLVTDTCRVQKT